MSGPSTDCREVRDLISQYAQVKCKDATDLAKWMSPVSEKVSLIGRHGGGNDFIRTLSAEEVYQYQMLIKDLVILSLGVQDTTEAADYSKHAYQPSSITDAVPSLSFSAIDPGITSTTSIRLRSGPGTTSQSMPMPAAAVIPLIIVEDYSERQQLSQPSSSMARPASPIPSTSMARPASPPGLMDFVRASQQRERERNELEELMDDVFQLEDPNPEDVAVINRSFEENRRKRAERRRTARLTAVVRPPSVPSLRPLNIVTAETVPSETIFQYTNPLDYEIIDTLRNVQRETIEIPENALETITAAIRQRRNAPQSQSEPVIPQTEAVPLSTVEPILRRTRLSTIFETSLEYQSDIGAPLGISAEPMHCPASQPSHIDNAQSRQADASQPAAGGEIQSAPVGDIQSTPAEDIQSAAPMQPDHQPLPTEASLEIDIAHFFDRIVNISPMVSPSILRPRVEPVNYAETQPERQRRRRRRRRRVDDDSPEMDDARRRPSGRRRRRLAHEEDPNFVAPSVNQPPDQQLDQSFLPPADLLLPSLSAVGMDEEKKKIHEKYLSKFKLWQDAILSKAQEKPWQYPNLLSDMKKMKDKFSETRDLLAKLQTKNYFRLTELVGDNTGKSMQRFQILLELDRHGLINLNRNETSVVVGVENPYFEQQQETTTSIELRD